MTSVPLMLLQADALFSGVDAKAMARLLGAMERVDFAPGQSLYQQGEAATALYLLTDGAARLTTQAGHDIGLQPRRCGEEAAAGLPRYACTVTADTALQAWRLPRAALAELARSQAGFGTNALLLLAPYLDGAPQTLQSKPKPDGAQAASAATLLGWTIAVLGPPLVYRLAQTSGLSDQAAVFSAILMAAVLMWVFSLVDEFIPPLLAVVATLFIGLAPPGVALAGFASPGLVTLLGVFALAAVIGASGLSYRTMLWLLTKLPDKPIWQQSALLLAGYVLSTITPSGNSRLALLVPLYRDMVDGLRLPRQGVMATALMAATFSGAMLFSPMLATSKASNITAVGLMPAAMQEQFLGLFWLAAAAVAAVAQTVLHLVAMRWLFRGDNPLPLPKDRIATQLALLGKLTGAEQIALGGFGFFLVGAATVSWHHVQPSLIAGCVLIGLLLSGLFGKQEFRQQLDWPMLFFLLGMDSITKIMGYLGLDTELAAAMSHSFGFIDGRIEWFILAALATTLILRLALPTVAGMLVAAVILMPVALAQGIHPWICVFLTAIFSDIWFLPYQTGVYTQVESQGLTQYFNESRFMVYNHLMNLSRVAVVFLSIPYWKWLGLL